MADENLHSQVVAHLRNSGMDVRAVREEGWSGKVLPSSFTNRVADPRAAVRLAGRRGGRGMSDGNDALLRLSGSRDGH